MLLKQAVLQEIAAGRVTLAFRRWRRPTVRAGGTLRTAVGVLAIDAVDVIDAADITAGEAARAGASLAAVLDELARHPDRDAYRIAFHLAGEDARIALREQAALDDGDLAELRARLERLDRASRVGAWTASTLRAIAEQPGVRAGDLAAAAELETQRFKRNVRRLKELGLTESLEVGYRLSPRGEALLNRLDSAP